MKALGIVASPRRAGNTAWLVGKVLEGTGAGETKVLSLNGVAPCTSCFACKGTARCVLQDAMQDVYRELDSADLVVLGSPIYLDHVSAQTWTMLGRLYCYIGPAPKLGDLYKGARRWQLVATQGRPDAAHYLPQLDQIAAILAKYWHIEARDHLAIGGCRREGGLESRPEAAEAALAAGRKLAAR